MKGTRASRTCASPPTARCTRTRARLRRTSTAPATGAARFGGGARRRRAGLGRRSAGGERRVRLARPPFPDPDAANRARRRGRGDQVFSDVVPIVVDGAPVDVRIASTWMPAPSRWPRCSARCSACSWSWRPSSCRLGVWDERLIFFFFERLTLIAGSRHRSGVPPGSGDTAAPGETSGAPRGSPWTRGW